MWTRPVFLGLGLLSLAFVGVLLQISPAHASSETPPLWDQYNNASYGSMTSQDFEPAMDQYDSFGADDFTVPARTDWRIDGVDVQGACARRCLVERVNVRFYANTATNLPGTLVCERPNEAATGVPTKSPGVEVKNLRVDLSSPCDVGPGAYWLSVQSRQDSQAGQWFWTARTRMSGNAGAAWQNPGDGFGTGCVSWGRRTQCDSANADPDNVFRLRGTTGPTPTAPPPPPPPSPQVRCRVPRVIGLKLGKAKAKIRKAHCSAGRVRRARSGRVGRVTRQSPRPGRRLVRGTRVNLVVGSR